MRREQKIDQKRMEEWQMGMMEEEYWKERKEEEEENRRGRGKRV